MSNKMTHDERIAKLNFSAVYPMYIKKVESKGRTKEELHQVIHWLTGFDDEALQSLIKENVTFEAFFERAAVNPKVQDITGLICGYRVEEIQNQLTQKIRYLDKLIDELAKGKKLDKIMRE
ncbi:MAG TPA: DUF2200 domain-containing protein [Flavobacterium sp.]|jgi:hypothetical protein